MRDTLALALKSVNNIRDDLNTDLDNPEERAAIEAKVIQGDVKAVVNGAFERAKADYPEMTEAQSQRAYEYYCQIYGVHNGAVVRLIEFLDNEAQGNDIAQLAMKYFVDDLLTKMEDPDNFAEFAKTGKIWGPDPLKIVREIKATGVDLSQMEALYEYVERIYGHYTKIWLASLLDCSTADVPETKYIPAHLVVNED